jgi:hypothetical protein
MGLGERDEREQRWGSSLLGGLIFDKLVYLSKKNVFFPVGTGPHNQMCIVTVVSWPRLQLGTPQSLLCYYPYY